MANIIPPEVLLGFYKTGVFPMSGPDGIRLFSPDPRGVIPLEKFRIPHGARRTLRDPAWTVSIDQAFDQVMLACSEREETWIDETIFLSYFLLHRTGHAHSIEVWRDGELAGGLYGVKVGAVFFGESMFHLQPGASKVALVKLVELLKSRGFVLLDTQWVTPHLKGFGAEEISRADFLEKLADGISLTASLPQPGFL